MGLILNPMKTTTRTEFDTATKINFGGPMASDERSAYRDERRGGPGADIQTSDKLATRKAGWVAEAITTYRPALSASYAGWCILRRSSRGPVKSPAFKP